VHKILIGEKLKSLNGKSIKVMKELGAGGQGTVFQIKYDNEKKALKWYHANKLKDGEKFYQTIVNKIGRAPSDDFLWLEDVTEWKGGTFGYVMPLRPTNYQSFCDYLNGKVAFANLYAMVNAALNVSRAFEVLHNQGYSYQDLNDGNFFMNFETGQVLICDNDNVSPYGENSGIKGKARYMAPEVVVGRAMPNKQTDRFSLSVILFMLLTRSHPLEGKQTTVPCLHEKNEVKFYGLKPVFIYDPDIEMNRPVRGVHIGALKFWNEYPKFVQNEFIEAFSQEMLIGSKSQSRILEKEWIDLFVRLRDRIVTCPCGDQYFADPERQKQCPSCQKAINYVGYFQVNKFKVPIVPSIHLYAFHTDRYSDDFGKVTGEIVKSKNNARIGLKNVTTNTWYLKDKTGVTKAIAPNEVVRVVRSLKLDLGQGNVLSVI
jgi:serine/threonine protein kinase